MTLVKAYDRALLRLDTLAEGDLRLSPRALVSGALAAVVAEPAQHRRTT